MAYLCKDVQLGAKPATIPEQEMSLIRRPLWGHQACGMCFCPILLSHNFGHSGHAPPPIQIWHANSETSSGCQFDMLFEIHIWLVNLKRHWECQFEVLAKWTFEVPKLKCKINATWKAKSNGHLESKFGLSSWNAISNASLKCNLKCQFQVIIMECQLACMLEMQIRSANLKCHLKRQFEVPIEMPIWNAKCEMAIWSTQCQPMIPFPSLLAQP